MVITGHGELLRRRLEDGDPRLRKVQHMMSAADRASRLVRQLLAFSRSQALDPRVVDLNRLVTDAARMLRPVLGGDVSLTTDLAGDLGRVRVDPGQVEQVLMNLAVNARDAMPVGGTLSFETANRRLEKPGPVPPGDYVVLTVRDTGTGMDAGTRSHVFEPFFTTKASGEGTGLGLAMAYGVVEQSRGHILLESEPGRGTAFRIHLPRIEGEVDDEPTTDVGQATRGDETVLVVEDEPSIRDLARELLEGLGYEVFEAETTEQALAAARNHTGRIDLTLADVVLPGVDVRDLVARLQSLHPEMRVLYMSGHGAATLSTHGISEGRPDFLPKPFGQAQLARRVRQVLDQPPSPPSPRGPSVNRARP
jgi:CheY-like chemotaxis protein